MGGKWTAFRKMGVDTVDKILEKNKDTLETKYEQSQTLKFSLVGSYSKAQVEHGIKRNTEQLAEQYEDHFVFQYDIPRDVARNLYYTYGTTSIRVVKLGEQLKLNQRIHPDYPFLKSEFAYAARHELAEKPNDIICRRVPIAFLNKKLAQDILPEVVEILGKEKKWSTAQKKLELEEAFKNLDYLM